ncbi:MAG: PH domain-containing protein [Gemmatimonadales bacterium]
MSYLDDHLLTGERIVYRAKLHWTIFLTAIVVVVLGIALGILLQVVEPAYSLAGAALAGIGLLLAIGPAVRYISSEFAVTDKRVLGKLGFIERESKETLLSKVEAIAIDQGVIGRILGFGTVTITGTGGTQESFPRISEPLEFRRQIQSQIIAQEERRGSPAPAAAAVSGEPREPRTERDCPYCAERILARARVCKHCGRDVAPDPG